MREKSTAISGVIHSHSTCFTLLELLIAIAIITILAALLFPALNAARNVSKRIKCTSNLKNLSLYNANYINDFRGYTAPYRISGKRWDEIFLSQGYVPQYKISDKAVNYIQVKLRCPSSRKTLSGIMGEYADWWNQIGGIGDTYGWNAHFGYREGDIVLADSISSPRVKRPAMRIVVGDRSEGLLSLPASIDGANRPLGDVHSGTTPVAFLDGHVQTQNPRNINPPGTVIGVSNPDGTVCVACLPAGGFGISSEEIKYMWGAKSYQY